MIILMLYYSIILINISLLQNKKDHVPCRQGSKRRSFGGDRTIMNKASKTSGTKAESPPSCWSSSSESENSAKLDEEESRSEDISEKQKKTLKHAQGKREKQAIVFQIKTNSSRSGV